MIALAVEALIASAVLMALVLLIRHPVRRLFGAPVAYALWALPVLRLILPPLPAGWRDQVVAPLAMPLATPFADVGQQASILLVPASDGVVASVAPLTGLALVLVWSAGAAAFLLWQIASYVRFRRGVLADAVALDRVGGVTIVASARATGPLAFGVARRFVAFPRDFAGRYDPAERALALAHELGHHARGDLVANWVALSVLALHWYNPVAWLAFRAFRADQEMANDARVLAGRTPAERHAYACAIVKAAHGGAIAAACHLHTIDDLKGRLRMLSTPTTRARIVAGTAAVALLAVAGLGLTASGTEAAERVRAGVEDVTGVDLAAVATPAQALAAVQEPAAPAKPRRNRVVVTTDAGTRVYEGAEAEAYLAANPLPPVPAVPAIPAVPAVSAVPAMPSFPSMPSVPAIPPMPAMPEPPSFPETAWSHGTERAVARAGAAADRASLAALRAARQVPQVVSRNCGGEPRTGEQMVVQSSDHGRRLIMICTDRIARASSIAEARARVDVQAARRHAYAGMRTGLAHARASIASNPHLTDEDRREALADLDQEIADAEHEIATED